MQSHAVECSRMLALEHLHQPLVPRLLALVGRKYEREVVAACVHAVIGANGECQPRVGEVGFAQLLGGVLPRLRQAVQLPPLHELGHSVGEQSHLLGRVREVDGHQQVVDLSKVGIGL